MIRTRMAPSPTGEYHIGHVRTLLYNYAFAKKHKGKFIIRIEDTDQARLVPGAVEKILQVIKDYGLDWDEGPDKDGPYGPYVQSQRLEIYKKYAEKLVEEGKAYVCFCSSERLSRMREEQKERGQVPKYDRRCWGLAKEEVKKRLKRGESHVVRLKVPDDRVVSFEDLVAGKVEIRTRDLDDQVLLKSDGFPTYHLAVVVDDYLMKISHVIRGVEWISSTPKHILLYQAFGWPLPIYAHLPVLLDKDRGGKLSKRSGATSARSFLDRGYLPEAVLNYLMLLGWAPKDDREIFSLEEFGAEFVLSRLNKANPAFDIDKLKWFNIQYLKRMPDEELGRRLQKFLRSFGKSANQTGNAETLAQIAPLVKERITTLGEFEELAGFFFTRPETPKEGWKKESKKHLERALAALEKVGAEDWGFENLNKVLMGVVEKEGLATGAFFMSLRLAVCGKKVTPPLTESLAVLGKEETTARLRRAVKWLQNAA